MLQFYFLSVAANLLAGFTLSGEWIAQRFNAWRASVEILSGRRLRMVTGLLSILAGLGTLFVPAGGLLILGDLFPSVVSLGVGIALLFEALRQEAILPSDSPREERPWRAPPAYRTALGVCALAAAVLHFFLPERLFF